MTPDCSDLVAYLDSPRPCIVCNGNDFEPWASQGFLTAKRCRSCGMISVNPHLTEQGLELFYSTYFAYHRSDRVKNEQREKMYLIDRDWVSTFVPAGKVLDIGCSGGYFLSVFPVHRWERYGVEIDPAAAEHARAVFNIPVWVGRFLDMEIEPGFDLIMMRGVIEHFRDPVPVLAKCASLLKPNGCLFISATPAGDSFAFYIYREKWRLFTPFEHIHFFTVALLTRLVQNFGLELVAHHYQYQETPYADPMRDYEKMRNDIIALHTGAQNRVSLSGPFPGSMITALWKKQR